MNNTTLARLCVNTNMSEEEEDELTAFLKQISENAESNKEYKSTLTDYNIPMEAEYNGGYIYSENATVAKAYKDRMRLYALARSSNSSVRLAIAGFEYAPDEALLYLANNNLEMCKRSSQDIADAEKRDREICTAIASNPNASPYTLDILATTIINRAENSREAREWKWAVENIELLQSALERYESEKVTNRYLTPKQRKQIIKETRNEIERKEGEKLDREERIEQKMGKIVRALANNDNTPTKAKNLMAEAANNGWFKAVNLDVDPTYSQEMKLKLVERRLEICKESIDDTMLPYLRRYCYNCIFTDAENGVRRIEELYKTIRLGGPAKSSRESEIAKMCMKKVAVKAGPDIID